jgi:dTDP-4-dehydrorhamnose reductase
MTILVLGASGQVASHLRGLLRDAVYWGRQTFDLAGPSPLTVAIRELGPSVIVNAAAHTAVDQAESEADLAWRLNAEVPAAAARAAAALDIPFVQISTDYVFDGQKAGSYEVGDAVAPLNVYGATKLAGELATRTLCPKHWILRTSWVFSEHGTNFVKTILRLARTEPTLRVVADQHGRPTYAGDLARLIARLVAHDDDGAPALPYGTLHAVGGPATTWFGFAEAIVAEGSAQGLIDRRPEMVPITTAEYPLPARRPANSVLEPSADLAGALDWVAGLRTVVARLKEGYAGFLTA